MVAGMVLVVLEETLVLAALAVSWGLLISIMQTRASYCSEVLVLKRGHPEVPGIREVRWERNWHLLRFFVS